MRAHRTDLEIIIRTEEERFRNKFLERYEKRDFKINFYIIKRG